MTIIERENLHQAVQYLKKLKIQLIGKLPHEGEYALHFINNAISTGILNNTTEIKIHIPTRSLSFYHDEYLQTVNLLQEDVKDQIRKIIDTLDLEYPDIEFPQIPAQEFDQFLDYAVKANQIMENFRLRLSGNTTFNHLWGHNFDFSVVQYFEEGRQVGIGISPGDSYSSQPYLYVNPWPVPEGFQNTNLPIGRIWTDEWTGIMVSWNELLDQTNEIDSIEQLYKMVMKQMKV